MIFVDLSEGLGNQMFQYAYSRYLQELYGGTLYLNTSSFKRKNSTRSYSLNNFYLYENVKLPSKFRRVIYNFYSKTIRMFIKKVIRMNPYSDKYYFSMIPYGFYVSSQVFKYLTVPTTKRHNIFVMGTWQTNKYFQSINDKIKDELKVKTEPNELNKKLITEINSNQSVCVHIRLGDYTNPEFDYLHVCTSDYYLKGMDYIVSKVKEPNFYIFSNSSSDIEWIKNNYNFKYKVKYIDLNNPDFEDFRLMYNCKHFIISNSTFSWWAQFLSNNDKKIIVAPSKWQKSNENEAKDIYLDHWKLIEIE
ncbi:alpha-1,2-fucosyltransferase [Carnobacterium inhibens]|uniref:Glycosyl transferase n=1 Tax=Carnobacterium inhibens subsp. gilichinskyi TaxID=1266845 RepID=U5SA50_9LACT|nr:alpha-1,2-fucosyltransferase [Carnobacterium inhibens]AGY81956.1 glycosyl transferase [Carnobacterium inhibens subsp. gilichinskyi]